MKISFHIQHYRYLKYQKSGPVQSIMRNLPHHSPSRELPPCHSLCHRVNSPATSPSDNSGHSAIFIGRAEYTADIGAKREIAPRNVVCAKARTGMGDHANLPERTRV